jgi:DNA-binding NarL/FixJ family response regulator
MIKILLVEKNLILSNTIREHLNKDEQLNVVGISKEGNEALEFLKTNPIDIIILDYQQTNGLVVTQQMKKTYPNINIIGFSSDFDTASNRMIELGASSYLSKYETSLEELITEIKGCYKAEH